MTREFEITPIRTYSTKDNVRKAILKSGDEGIRHSILPHVLTETGAIRWFAVFFPNEDQLVETGIHFRWNVVR